MPSPPLQANYVTGSLLALHGDGADADDDAVRAAARRPTEAHGVVEMGGASLQIAFYDEESNAAASPSSSSSYAASLSSARERPPAPYRARLGASHVDLFAKSHAGLGQSAAQRSMYAHLAETSCAASSSPSSSASFPTVGLRGGATAAPAEPCTIVDACRPVGGAAKELRRAADGGGAGATLREATRVIAPDGARVAAGWDVCLAQIRAALALELGLGSVAAERSSTSAAAAARYDACAARFGAARCALGDYQPPLPREGGAFGEFVLLSTFARIWRLLGLPSRGASLADVEAAGRALCALDLHALEVEHACSCGS